MNKYSLDYYKQVQKILTKIIKEESVKISLAASMIKDSYLKGGQLYVFGTGHSHMMAEDSFHRAGGFAAACPILDNNIDFTKGAEKATKLERTPLVARKVLKKYNIRKKDILIIFSNSGVNHVPVETALIAKEKKIKTISILSHKYSKVAPLSKLKKRLFEITDMFIDNKIPIGDSLTKINNISVGPASTI
ncbi:sugar isomerase domain-containing protein, partial [Alphaproteobacteria bacterium]|nr:sugar isomerase domain-containing protein [Alphaproteobacteria bacterium]